MYTIHFTLIHLYLYHNELIIILNYRSHPADNFRPEPKFDKMGKVWLLVICQTVAQCID